MEVPALDEEAVPLPAREEWPEEVTVNNNNNNNNTITTTATTTTATAATVAGWENWTLPRRSRLLFIVSSLGNEKEPRKLFEDVSTAITTEFQRDEAFVTVLFRHPDTTHELVKCFVGKGPWDVIHLVAHTSGGMPHFPTSERPHMLNTYDQEWWRALLHGAVQPQLVVFSCCGSERLAKHVSSEAGICVWAPAEVYLDTVPAFISGFYGKLRAGVTLRSALAFANEAMVAKGAELDRVRATKRVASALSRPGLGVFPANHGEMRLIEPLVCQRGQGPLGQLVDSQHSGCVCNHATQSVVGARLHAFQASTTRAFVDIDDGGEDNLVCHLAGRPQLMEPLALLKCVVLAEPPGAVTVIGWPGFGKTRLCRELLRAAAAATLHELPASTLIFYIACRHVTWRPNLSSFLQEVLCLPDWGDIAIIVASVMAQPQRVIWLLDDFQSSDEDKFPAVLRQGRQIRFVSSCCETPAYTLAPLTIEQGTTALERAMSRIPTRIPAQAAKAVPPKAIRACQGRDRIDVDTFGAFLQHHPIWVNWAYDDEARPTCDMSAYKAPVVERQSDNVACVGADDLQNELLTQWWRLDEAFDSVKSNVRREELRQWSPFITCCGVMMVLAVISLFVVAVVMSVRCTPLSVRNATVRACKVITYTDPLSLQRVHVGVLGIPMSPAEETLRAALPYSISLNGQYSGGHFAPQPASLAEANASITPYTVGMQYATINVADREPGDALFDEVSTSAQLQFALLVMLPAEVDAANAFLRYQCSTVPGLAIGCGVAGLCLVSLIIVSCWMKKRGWCLGC
jgi:hypothetical protein